MTPWNKMKASVSRSVSPFVSAIHTEPWTSTCKNAHSHTTNVASRRNGMTPQLAWWLLSEIKHSSKHSTWDGLKVSVEGSQFCEGSRTQPWKAWKECASLSWRLPRPPMCNTQSLGQEYSWGENWYEIKVLFCYYYCYLFVMLWLWHAPH